MNYRGNKGWYDWFPTGVATPNEDGMTMLLVEYKPEAEYKETVHPYNSLREVVEARYQSVRLLYGTRVLENATDESSSYATRFVLDDDISGGGFYIMSKGKLRDITTSTIDDGGQLVPYAQGNGLFEVYSMSQETHDDLDPENPEFTKLDFTLGEQDEQDDPYGEGKKDPAEWPRALAKRIVSQFQSNLANLALLSITKSASPAHSPLTNTETRNSQIRLLSHTSPFSTKT